MRTRDPIIGKSYFEDDGKEIWEGRDFIAVAGVYKTLTRGRQFRDSQKWPPPQWHGRRARPGVQVWRSTLVYWEAVDDAVARLARVTDLEREVTGHRHTAPAKDVTAWWACRRCGCVTRRPEHAPDADLQHYTDCVVDVWRESRYASKLLRCRMQTAQGIVARSYRCWECRRVCSEAQLEEAQEQIEQARGVELRNFHRSRCSSRAGSLTSKTGKRAELFRSREVSGQEVMFTCQP